MERNIMKYNTCNTFYYVLQYYNAIRPHDENKINPYSTLHYIT